MRLYCTELVFAAVLLASLEVTSAHAIKNLEKLQTLAIDRTEATIGNLVPAQRLLRAVSAVDENDEERAINFKSITGVDKLTNYVNKQKLASWLKKGKAADNVFAKMKLGKAGGNLFENPKFVAWSKYVDDYNSKNPDKATSMIPTLTANFGDDGLAKMLEAALKVDSTKFIASKLQTQQIKYWESLGMSTDDVFRALKLNGNLDDVLSNPNLLAFNKYMIDFNTWNPNKATTMIETLTRSYGDVAVLKMLDKATKVGNAKDMAARLQIQQLEVWRDMGLNTDDVFRLLNLDDAVDNIFANPVFSMWLRYLDDFNANNPTKTTTVFATFKSHFSDSVMSQLLIAAKKVPSTEKMATKLQNQQLRTWLDKKELPDTVFKFLMLDKGADNLLSNPQLSTWVKYANAYKTENPFTTKASMISTFRAHYTDTSLAKMLISAKKVSSTEKLATNLERALLTEWAGLGKTPAYVSKVLGTSPDAKLLQKAYLQKLNVANPA